MPNQPVPSIFRTVFEHAPIGLEIVDGTGRIVQVNPAYAAMFGRTVKQLVGSTIAEVTQPDDMESSAAAFEDLLAGRLEHLRVEKRCLRADGTMFPTRVIASLLPGGDHTLVVGLVEDLTAEQQEQEARQSHVRDLHEANERLEAFSSTVAHELAQPIQSITGMLDTVMRMTSDLPDDVVALMQRASAGALRLQEIVDAMLGLAGDGELRATPTDLAERLDRVRSALAEQIRRSDATVEAADLPRVTADPMAIEVVLQNLISNALVHAGPGVTVTVGGPGDG